MAGPGPWVVVAVAGMLAGCAPDTSDSATAGPNPPEVYLTSPAPASVWTTDGDVPLLGVVVDDGTAPETLGLVVTSDRDGELATPPVSQTGQIEALLTLSEGAHVLTVTATDAAGHATVEEVPVVVATGSAPSQPAARIDPADAITGDPLLASLAAEAIDPEGDPLAYVWAWTVDGVAADLPTPEVPAGRVFSGETWTVSVYATDGTTASRVATRSVLIGDGAPDPGPVTVVPDAPTASDALTCEHGIPLDPEGDRYTFAHAWTIAGVASPVVGAVLPAGSAHRGDAVTCAVVVDDGVVTTWPSAEVRLADAPPSVGTVSVTPASGDTTTTFTCAAHGLADPDGDVVHVTIAWTVAGVPVATGPTLLPGLARRGDTLACTATPDDGAEIGPAVTSATLVLDDAPPGPPEVAFAPPDAVAGSPASCIVVTGPVDPDGDAVTLTWAWTLDGVPLPDTDPTVLPDPADAGASLTCTATPDDGTLAGPSGSASAPLGEPTRGAIGPADAWVTLLGSTASGQFGKVVDGVADLDGDGLDELVVGAPRGDGAGRGAVYLFTSTRLAAGGVLTDLDADALFVGHTTDALLGSARGAAGVGDVDGDGLGDLVAAAPYADEAGVDAGQVYLLRGGDRWTRGADVATVAVATFHGDAGDALGVRCAGGDLDGDGVDDLALSAPYADLAADRAGVVGVWFGGGGAPPDGALADADARITGVARDDQLGWALAWSPDGDADGYADLVVGVFADDTHGTDAGSAAVLSGGGLRGTVPYDTAGWLVVRGLAPGDRLGYDVAGPGDVDGDGLADVAIGAYLSDGVGTDAGAVHLFAGRAGVNHVVDADEADATFLGDTTGDLFGGAADGAGDFDGDGLSDLLFGASRADAGGTDAGAVGLFLGASAAAWSGATPAADADVRIVGAGAGALLGDELAGGFDLDGDGLGEIAVGAQGAEGAVAGAGAVYVFRGP